jgi:sulfate/thiosulfate transport system ATP-binding protein
MNIETRSLHKTFGSFQALDDINLSIHSGELLALLGPSGSGKTTLLRIIAGLEVPDTGQGGVLFDNKEVTFLSARDRGVGFVFQHYALFRHMSVFENIAFGLNVRPRHQRPGKAEIAERVHRLLKLVQLEGLEKRLPSQLSGGQRQRVALARALAVDPKVLLLDEPFGALDAKVRKELRRWLRQLHEEIHVTSIFVTHDQEEALELADRVVVMSNGRIEQAGTPEEVYDKPSNPFVFNFLGDVNTLPAKIVNGTVHVGDLRFPADAPGGDEPEATAFIRPHEFEIHSQPPLDSALSAEVVHILPVGSIVRVELLRSEDRHPLEVELTRERYHQLQLKNGCRVFLTAHKGSVFPPDYSI